MRCAVYSKSLTVPFRKQVLDDVKRITDERQTSMAEFIRRAVDAALSTESERKENQNEQIV